MPTASPLFVDKISLTFALHDESAHGRISEWFVGDTTSVRGYPVSWTRGSRFYSHSKEIVFDAASNCKLLAEFHRRGRLTQQPREYERDPETEPDVDIQAIHDRRPFRLEWNPAQLLEVPDYQAAFVSIMQDWFGNALAEEMIGANVTRIDLATDIRGLNVNRIIAVRNDTTVTSAGYRRDGKIQSLYLGGKNTSLRIVIYDKRAQRRERVRGGQYERTRIEIRLKQRLTFDALRNYPNPFSRLTIRELRQMEISYPQNSPHYWDWFVDSCKVRGAEAALNLIRNSRTRRSWSNKIAEVEEPSWWRPEELWSGLNDAIYRLGLFPPMRRVRR